MGFLLKEQREALLIEYKHLSEELWERNFSTWVVISILTIGSLLVAFVPTVENFPTPIASLVLIASAIILSATSDRLLAMICDRMEYVAKQLRIHEPKEICESRMSGQWWHYVRRNIAYALYVILIGIYLFLIFDNFVPLPIAIAVGFLLIIIRERIALKKESPSRLKQSDFSLA